ncbi:hypothetical protein OOT46_17685 [Aquabacterium sp. A7-Y]|uniref:hypothetical protein n=1 Tax=Aquabacterium sp. A7-Y TaxID=1349605 RepID=UPI00223CF2E7|nr:hypothetical protein [Aquabacterium sp. A7-Y]MCW7539673.1 hypothetical protein [Aquabacterium sp. A7-Y]
MSTKTVNVGATESLTTAKLQSFIVRIVGAAAGLTALCGSTSSFFSSPCSA